MLVVGIAGTEYLLSYLETRAKEVRVMEYNDHYAYTEADISDISRHFALIEDRQNAIILTTEKDAMRLDVHRQFLLQQNLPVYILPVTVEFLGENQQSFEGSIKEWLLNFKR